MKTKIFHGTTQENAMQILHHGFNSKNLLWNCSDDNMSYFWNLSKIEEYDDIADNINYAIESAFQSACTTAALQNTEHDYVSVFEIEIDNELLNDDDSCENMSYASQIDSEELNRLIKSGEAKIIKIHKCRYYKSMKLFYIKGLSSNQYTNMQWFLDDVELKAIELLPDDLFIDELFYVEKLN